MRCPRCGNENPDDNRFCGMCGASLLAPASKTAPQPVAVVAAAPAAQVASATPRIVPEPRTAAPEPDRAPVSPISGPSFLGLNDPPRPATAPRKRASLSIDPNSAPGSNLDYLLDEEERRGGWGIGKILVILIALGLAVGFGYLRWKNQGFAWLNPSAKKPSAVAQNSIETPAPVPSTPSGTPDSQPPASQPAASAAQPAAPSAAGNAPPSTSSPSTGSTPATAAAANPSSSAPAADTSKPTDSASEKTTPPPDKDSSTDKESSPDAAAPASARAETPKPAPKPASPKPSAARPTAAYDTVAQAQKYLYGRGAPQDCERGLRLLKPEANKANPKAMIEMGALYSAGLCTPHDLPTAYRWFAMALRKDPENTSVQTDLQKLWGEMTQPERQLAIKLTQ